MSQTDEPPQHAGSPAASPRSSTSAKMLAALGLMATLMFSMPIVFLAAIDAWQNNSNDLISWADEELPIRKQFGAFVEYFGRPEWVVVSWQGCRAESLELQQLADSLKDTAPGWFEKVITTQSSIERLMQMPDGDDAAHVRRELRGILVGKDGELACLVVALGSTGREQRPAAIGRVRTLASEVGIGADQLRVGGIGAELAALDYESVAAPVRLAPYIGVCMLVLTTVFLRSFLLALFVSTLGSYTGVLSVAIIHWCGVHSNGVLATLPTLGGLLTVSLALHFIGYYKHAHSKVLDGNSALKQAFTWAWKPTLVSALTTSLGLGSLMLSRTLTIQQFGIFGAMTTLCAAVLVLSALPAFLYLLGDRVVTRKRSGEDLVWSRWMSFLLRNAKPIIATVSILICVMGFGLRFLRTNVFVDNLFVSEHAIVQDDRWMETYLGPMSSLEVVLSFPDSTGSRRHLTDDIVFIQRLMEHVRETNRFSILVTAATGTPDLDQHRGISRLATMARLRKWIDCHLDELKDSGLYTESGGERHWRMSVRINTLGRTDSVEANSDLQRKLSEVIDAFIFENTITESVSAASVRYFITGLPLLFEQIEHQFIEDLLTTYVGGLILVSVAVFFVLRSISDAATAMIPNVLPAIGVLGGISLLGIQLDVGSVMTASIALGVAVDDTLHFVLWYQKELKAGADSEAAVRSAVTHCGSPIVQTSVICGIGLAILGFAPFLPTARFGTLIALMLAVALIGDLLFLPAMLLLRQSAPRRKQASESSIP